MEILAKMAILAKKFQTEKTGKTGKIIQTFIMGKTDKKDNYFIMGKIVKTYHFIQFFLDVPAKKKSQWML